MFATFCFKSWLASRVELYRWAVDHLTLSVNRHEITMLQNALLLYRKRRTSLKREEDDTHSLDTLNTSPSRMVLWMKNKCPVALNATEKAFRRPALFTR